MNSSIHAKRGPKAYVSASLVGIIVTVGVIAIVVLQYRWNQTMLFDPPKLAELAYRGDDGEEIPPKYGQDDIEEFAAILRAAIKESYRANLPAEKGFSLLGPKPSQVRMGMEFKELRDGSLILEVVAYKKAGGTQQRENAWVQKFPNAELYKARVDQYASQIVTDLWPAKTGARDGI